jgi:beta-lactamase class A
MQRATFLSLALAGATLPSQLDALIARSPARVAVFAQRLSEPRPAVSIRADEAFPAASLIKLAIMLAAYRAIDRKKLRLTTEIPIGVNDIVAGSDSFGSVRPGSTAPVSRLLKAMIQQSDNTAGNALLRSLGFADVNAVIASYGLTDTKLQRYFMHFSTTHDNLTTARDIATLLLTIERAHDRAAIDLLLGQEDHETIAAGLPPGVPLANKTGELVGVRHDAAIVDPYGRRPYVLVVLTKNLTSQQQGVLEIEAISQDVYRSLSASAR